MLQFWFGTGIIAKARAVLPIGWKRKLQATPQDWAAYYRRTAGRQESGAAVLDSGSEVRPETNYGRITEQAELAAEQLAWTQARQARYARQAAQDALWRARSDALAWEARLAQDALEAQRAFEELMQQQADLIWLMRQRDDEEALLLILLEAA